MAVKRVRGDSQPKGDGKSPPPEVKPSGRESGKGLTGKSEFPDKLSMMKAKIRDLLKDMKVVC